MVNRALKVNEIVESVSITHSFDTDELIAVNTSDVLEGHFLAPELLPVSQLKGQFKKTIRKDDILFSEIRPANKRYARVDFENTENYVVSTKLMVLRKFNTDVDLDYFFYWLTNEKTLKILQARAENRICSFPQITFELLSEYDVPIPQMHVQKKIAHILKTIDEKININKKINKEHESVSKILYHYWFNQFEFPNEEGKPYKSSGGKMVWNEEIKREIPEGWEIQRFDDLVAPSPKIHSIMAPDYKSQGKYPIVDQASDLITGYTDDESYLYNNDECVVFGDVTTCFKYINFPFAKGTDGTKIIKTKDNRIPSLLLYFLIKDCKLPNIGFARHFIFLREINVLVPDKNICDLFYENTHYLMLKRRNCILENQKLTSVRDFLLPLLINGQVTFKKNNDPALN